MLPPSLIDLTLARLSPPRHLVNPQLCLRFGNARYLQQAALAFKEPASDLPATYPLSGSGSSKYQITSKQSETSGRNLSVRPRNPSREVTSKLAQRVQALEKAAGIEESAFEGPTFSEEDLSMFYEEVLEHRSMMEDPVEIHQPETMALQDPEAQLREDFSIIDALHHRLEIGHATRNDIGSTTLAESLRQHTGTTVLAESFQAESIPDGLTPTYRRVLKEIQAIFGQLESLQAPIDVPTGLLSYREWEAIYRTCIYAGDGEAAETTLHLMKLNKVEVTEDHVNDVLAMYAESGNALAADRCLSRFVEGSPNETQRHLHIKAHLNACPPSSGTIPESALSTLHLYEQRSIPPAQKTYSKVISHLFSVPSSTSQAQAWDLFSHMRYVAHPNPDPILYTSMIRACASPYHITRTSEPERALDLWYEMTVEKNIPPNTGSYNAIILACARSGRKQYVSEAFRLAKEMLDSHRDAYGRPAFAPDRKTFIALLEGAKRIGDLARVRWMLVEMVSGKSRDVDVDEEAMLNVFHAYATYKPPFKRGLTRVVQEEEVNISGASETDPAIDMEQSSSEKDLTVPTNRTFSHIPPQSSTEVLHEVDTLFYRILEDTGKLPPSPDSDAVFPSEISFENVQPTTRLVNSYMSVHYKHGSFESSKNLFFKAFEEAGVERDARTYLEGMQNCAMSKKNEREVALKFADELYAGWTKIEEKNKGKLSARTVERLHVAYIKTLALTDNLDRAMSHLRHFVSAYPPSSIRDPAAYTKSPLRATQTRLVGARPLVRLSTPIDVPDDLIPPLLTFADLRAVHQRLVIAGNRAKDIAYITYVCKAYEWALRVRRDERMKAKPPKESVGIVAADEQNLAEEDEE
ncbi:hypothetical protein K435DRAFT_725478 [Dendrothele bispora CBS 962.96]|uniref:Pentacotripeptide-repeat region of PRORP domain-containing protein n=1 Tax=Dendrothele bispora (strain CBS 962.96) TaxID=1314807 RepID=A0A4S8LVL9_DENBC|nr:hypothetical protein K435DRAFT_725478 [Dendrothele bispora CBS 962.96]